MEKPDPTNWKFIAALILWGALSMPWLKEYGTFGAVIGGAITAVVWYGWALIWHLTNRKQ
jgi:hypothetical protein